MERLMNIIVPLLYLIITVIISTKKKEKKRGRQQTKGSDLKQPIHDKAATGGLMRNLKNVLKEMEKSVKEAQRAAGSPEPAGSAVQEEGYRLPKPFRTASNTPDLNISESAGRTRFNAGSTVPTDERIIADGKAHRAMELRARQLTPILTKRDGAPFGKDDLVKGIILSEILQPPVVLRRRGKERSMAR